MCQCRQVDIQRKDVVNTLYSTSQSAIKYTCNQVINNAAAIHSTDQINFLYNLRTMSEAVDKGEMTNPNLVRGAVEIESQFELISLAHIHTLA